MSLRNLFGLLARMRTATAAIVLALLLAGSLLHPHASSHARAAAIDPGLAAPTDLALTPLDSTLRATWTPSTDSRVAWQVFSTWDSHGLAGTKILGKTAAAADANGLVTGQSYTIRIQSMDAQGLLSNPVTASSATDPQLPMQNAAFYENFNEDPTANLPAKYKAGDLDPNYFDVRTLDAYGDLRTLPEARSVFRNERHYHTMILGSQGEAGVIIRPRVPFDISNGRVGTFQFETDLPPGQINHGKWYEIHLVDAQSLPSHSRDFGVGEGTSWPNSLEFGTYDSVDVLEAKGHNLPRISVNVGGAVTRFPEYVNDRTDQGFPVLPQYSPLNVRVPVVLKVSQTSAEMFINGKSVARASGFTLPFTKGNWVIAHHNYRSALTDNQFAKPESLTQQLMHWDTVQFDGPEGSYNPLVRTYIQRGCPGVSNLQNNAILDCSRVNTGGTIELDIAEDVRQARSAKLQFTGVASALVELSINGRGTIRIPGSPALTSPGSLQTYDFTPEQLQWFAQGTNQLKVVSSTSGVTQVQVEAVYPQQRTIANPPMHPMAMVGITKDNFRLDYIPADAVIGHPFNSIPIDPNGRNLVQTASTYLYNSGGTDSVDYKLSVRTASPWLTITNPAGGRLDGGVAGATLSGSLAPAPNGGKLDQLTFTVDFAKVPTTGTPANDALGVPALIQVDGGAMPMYIAVLAVKSGGYEVHNLIPTSAYTTLYMNSYDKCGDSGSIGVPGYEGSCGGAPPRPNEPATGTPTPTATPGSTATPTPSSTPTSTPTPTGTPPSISTRTPTATPTVAPQVSFTSQATVNPVTVARRGTITINSSITSAKAMPILADVEIYSPSGEKVLQKWFSKQAFTAGQTRRYKATWRVPAGSAAGTYVVKIGVFSPDGKALHHWNDDAARFSVT